ncbi:melanoma-associated antigen B3-like [Suncus etruscus]|uniref:melanoma-associated antigen B3-like n=1 Tax=Suncus etruscus TaxID=109475 RepID=UPI00210F25FF|nr:melanoma-associated antigen B3-like [Suncus etruscus]
MKKPSTSEASFTSVKPNKDLLRKATSLLKEFLMISFKKKRLISQIEMLWVIAKKYECHFHEILKRDSLGIEIISGIDVKEMDSPKNCYVLVNKMNLPNSGRVNPGRGFPKTGLLMNILGVIFMKGNCASAVSIWEFLNKMKIYAGQKHFLFGKPKKLITEDLVKLKYLEYLQIVDSQPPHYKFLWGPRSHAEISKMRILQFLAKINNTVPSAFKSCYEEALEEQNENALLASRTSTSTMSENDPE